MSYGLHVSQIKVLEPQWTTMCWLRRDVDVKCLSQTRRLNGFSPLQTLKTTETNMNELWSAFITHIHLGAPLDNHVLVTEGRRREMFVAFFQ